MKLYLEDLERPVLLETVKAHCAMRILYWEYNPGGIDLNQVRDVSAFYSVFLGKIIPEQDIMTALQDLHLDGYINLTFPDPINDPKGFIVRLEAAEAWRNICYDD